MMKGGALNCIDRLRGNLLWKIISKEGVGCVVDLVLGVS